MAKTENTSEENTNDNVTTSRPFESTPPVTDDLTGQRDETADPSFTGGSESTGGTEFQDSAVGWFAAGVHPGEEDSNPPAGALMEYARPNEGADSRGSLGSPSSAGPISAPQPSPSLRALSPASPATPDI